MPLADYQIHRSEAEFLFVPAANVLAVAEREGATPFDVPGVELGHHDGKCSFEAFITKYKISDPAIDRLAKIVHGADVKVDLYGELAAPGLKASQGIRPAGLERRSRDPRKGIVVYDALYGYCREKERRGPNQS